MAGFAYRRVRILSWILIYLTAVHPLHPAMAAAKTLADKGNVFIRWGITSATQDGAFAAGIVAGVPEGLHDSAIGLFGVLKEPKQTFMALKELINSDDVLGKVAQNVKQDWLSRIDRMEAHYQQAGASGAYDSGVEAGKLLVEYGGYALGAGGVATGSRAGEKVW
ncbi:hypothetical protein [Yersinia kristensenii]|uniref:hypothetical protein n=1 Tax=Yersinia kristensenii TaxID=28152 RepID=UPI0018E1AA7D|nr:hypothetical protein [Yersinia kristensenii]MDA5474908.1 hypothetical protein [Yersinia kristensenii]MDA5476586.1 hypothetical protein [Yersinia kristensenii]MDA5506368.1 hypothetical protein [Yersinia kristensenii]